MRAGLRHASPQETKQWLVEWFRRGFASGDLVCVDEVLQEVVCVTDQASDLLRSLKDEGLIQVLSPTPDTLSYIGDITCFVCAHFEKHQAKAFLRGSDSMIIALAKTHETTLITLENHRLPQYDGESGRIKGKVHVPYVAWAHGVRCIPLYQGFRSFNILEST